MVLKQWLILGSVALVSAAAYPAMRGMMLEQNMTYTTVQGSNDSLAVNYLLALYLYGLWADRLSKRIGKRKAWLVWGLGMIVILLALKYVFGWEARW